MIGKGHLTVKFNTRVRHLNGFYALQGRNLGKPVFELMGALALNTNTKTAVAK